MESPGLVALVGATGGAGTTRLAVECAATLAGTGRDVAVVDAAYDTQGLASVVEGAVQPDVTSVAVEGRPLAEALRPLDLSVPGSVAVAPARASFERLARAKASDAARGLAEALGGAAGSHDAVLVDAPPVASNQAVAAVTAADRVAVVVPDAPRGRDALGRVRGRLSDVDASADAVVANRADGEHALAAEADAAVPTAADAALPAAPTCPGAGEPFAPGVVAATEAATGLDLDVATDEDGGLSAYLPT